MAEVIDMFYAEIVLGIMQSSTILLDTILRMKQNVLIVNVPLASMFHICS